ncbi:hypothetical protein [Bradyrhizobium oligotrophicum]|uniref:hypothetical protein n=1 Tax=Bradyrhizobium oligotrophicum TaxID=44255 RepID=UPI003EB6DD47
MSDFQRVLRLFSTIFLVSALLAGALAGLDAWFHIPLADFLVKKLADIMFACVTACGGVIAGQKLESRKHRQRD